MFIKTLLHFYYYLKTFQFLRVLFLHKTFNGASNLKRREGVKMINVNKTYIADTNINTLKEIGLTILTPQKGKDVERIAFNGLLRNPILNIASECQKHSYCIDCKRCMYCHSINKNLPSPEEEE